MNAAYDRPINHPEFGYQNVSETIIDKLFEYPEYFKNLSYVSIKGGEPYMDPANKTMMRRLIEMNLNHQITLDVTTNGTIVDEEFHSLARQFKHTKWTVSLEAVVTVMTYNICHLKEIKEWYDSVKKDNYSIYFNNVVATPNYLNPSLLPQSILNIAREHNNIDINYSHDSGLSHLLPTFVSFTKDLDTLRETDVLTVCPEFKQLFTE
jgi:sulfatase maturation enzyme AslB (radical SAM superfamily)